VKIRVLIAAVALVFTPQSFSREETLNRDMGRLLENEKNTINIFREGVKSVVNVSNVKYARTSWFSSNVSEIPFGVGSGFVWDSKGHIVTNYHVIMEGDSFLISFHGDKKQYKAELVGAEPKQDIAVLKLKEMPKKLYSIKVGQSNDLLVGQKTLAIGNPFGLDHTITQGIVSALGRKIPGIGDVTIHGMIQTDSSINPGNSGGPLIDSTGELIGMNTIIYSKSGSSSGVGFAVPVDSIKRIVPQLIKHGKVIRPGLGVGILPEYHKSRFGVEEGLVVTFVDEDSGAFKAGLRGIQQDRRGRYYLGDVIIAVDGKKVANFDDIYHALNKYKVGDEVEVTYLHKGEKKKKAKVKLTGI
jgi:S1-C subfamily serine protease